MPKAVRRGANLLSEKPPTNESSMEVDQTSTNELIDTLREARMLCMRQPVCVLKLWLVRSCHSRSKKTLEHFPVASLPQ